MTILTSAQAAAYATQAGFSGSTLQTILAIAICESGLDTMATNTVGNSAGVDRGILQINSFYHKEVSDDCAFRPECAFQEAYRISSGATNFTPWTTYTNGCYLSHIQNAAYTGGDTSSTIQGLTTSLPTTPTGGMSFGLPDLSGLGAWIGNPIRIFKMLVGILLVGLSFFIMVEPDAMNMINKLGV